MDKENEPASVITQRHGAMVSLILNRPQALNSLNLDMIRLLTTSVRTAFTDEACRFLLFYGNGNKGFCAGGDIKDLAHKAAEKDSAGLKRFFEEEYVLDLMIHESPKPVIVIADGATMGGGLGIAAGADVIIATERTRMAMPETRIGFFPDVGATGWLFNRCPRGYPEYLSLTGYYMTGNECVRLGLATHLIRSDRIPELIRTLETLEPVDNPDRKALARLILSRIEDYLETNIPSNPEMDTWVAQYFADKSDLRDILVPLSHCGIETKLCDDVFASISERSPTALAATLKLLRHNEGRPLAEVFAAELRAAMYLTFHPDYTEGVRARVIDRDDRPQWQPDNFEKVDLVGFDL